MIFNHSWRHFRPFWAVLNELKKGPKKARKKRLTPYHIGQFWPLFQLFKNTSKTKAKHFWMIFNHSWRHFRPFWAVLKQLKKWLKRAKNKGLPLTILVNFGHFLNCLKTLQKQRLNTFESFSTTLDDILGLFERFWTSWKKGQKRPKSKG